MPKLKSKKGMKNAKPNKDTVSPSLEFVIFKS